MIIGNESLRLKPKRAATPSPGLLPDASVAIPNRTGGKACGDGIVAGRKNLDEKGRK